MTNLATNQISDLLSKLTESQIVTNSTITGIDNRLTMVENIVEKEVYLTNSQLRELSRQVKNRIMTICEYHNLDYKQSSRILFSAIYSNINGQYNVMSYRELPRKYYSEIIETAKIWDVTEPIIKRLRAA